MIILDRVLSYHRIYLFRHADNVVFQELGMVVSGLTSAVQESTYLLIAFCQSLEG